EQAMQKDSAKTVGGAFRMLTGPAKDLIPDAFKRGLTLVEKFSTKDPENGLTILEDVAPLDPKSEQVAPLRLDLLKRSVAAHSDNTNRLVELALVYEAGEKMDECKKLLLPRRDKLGSTEGARILGQQLMQEGDYEG